MKTNRGLFVLPTFIVILILSSAAVWLSLHYPSTWKNDPPKCCDIPNEGSNYGYPFHIKEVSCCGIAGTPLQSVHYENAVYNFLIYVAILLAIEYLTRGFHGKVRQYNIDD